MKTRLRSILFALGALGVASCGNKFSNDGISGYVGTWSYSISSLTLNCDDHTTQSSSGSGQILLSISADDPTKLEVAATSGCDAAPDLTEGSDGYDLVDAIQCPTDSGSTTSLTQYHVAVDTHKPTLLNFSRTTSTVEPSMTTCTTAESGVATKG